jgi:nicotinamidase-related amidase
MLTTDSTVLVVVDVQDKLVKTMQQLDVLIDNQTRLVRGMAALEVPMLCTEQNPKGLGATIPEIAALLPGVETISKNCFSCTDSQPFMQSLAGLDRKNVLLAGIETHICVYQTAIGLIQAGYHVEVVADACSSRRADNIQIGLYKANNAGAEITSVETALFELLKVADGPRFKEILQIVK